MDFRPVGSGPELLARYERLLQACFPGAAKFRVHYLDWLYRQNPDGEVVGFDAWAGDELAAHYVCVPATAAIGGTTVRVLLSLNTATHPQHQGKGLFTKLAEQTYRVGAERGFDAVYGVANANSTPGFVKKLGFQLIEPLLAKVGVGGVGGDVAALAAGASFRRAWTDASLAWRCANPTNPVSARPHRGGTSLCARAAGRGLTTVWAELGERRDVVARGPVVSPLRLFLGLLPAGARTLHGYVDIPARFRPSPLNLIHRSLTGRVSSIAPGSVFLTFADFDAY